MSVFLAADETINRVSEWLEMQGGGRDEKNRSTGSPAKKLLK